METHSHPCKMTDEELLGVCRIRRERRSGPGGQHRNKVETAVVLTHIPTGIEAEANERRSQAANKVVALFRLRLSLALKHRSAPITGPLSPLWSERTKEGRIHVSGEHFDFPILLAEALDHVVEREFDVSLAAKAVGVTTSQLVRLLKKHPAAFTYVNSQRQSRGLHTIK